MKRERNQINKIKNEKGDKTIDTAEIPKKKKVNIKNLTT